MPEGPEVAVVAAGVHKGLPTIFEAATIIENVPGKLHRYSKKKPKNWDVIANNRFEMLRVRTKGKLILIDIETLPNREPWVLLITLGMSGDLRWNSANHKHTRFAFLQHGRDLSFVDTRCFGTLRIVTPQEAREAESKIGWDFLKAPAPKEYWKQTKTTLSKKPIGPVLLNQKYFGGIGNIYKSEVIHRCRIHPSIPVKEIPDTKWERLNETIHAILLESYKLKGCSVVDFTADGVEGQAQQLLQVYMKNKCPKNHPIKTIKQEDRTTWYCPECQTKD